MKIFPIHTEKDEFGDWVAYSDEAPNYFRVIHEDEKEAIKLLLRTLPDLISCYSENSFTLHGRNRTVLTQFLNNRFLGKTIESYSYPTLFTTRVYNNGFERNFCEVEIDSEQIEITFYDVKDNKPIKGSHKCFQLVVRFKEGFIFTHNLLIEIFRYTENMLQQIAKSEYQEVEIDQFTKDQPEQGFVWKSDDIRIILLSVNGKTRGGVKVMLDSSFNTVYQCVAFDKVLGCFDNIDDAKQCLEYNVIAGII